MAITKKKHQHKTRRTMVGGFSGTSDELSTLKTMFKNNNFTDTTSILINGKSSNELKQM